MARPSPNPYPATPDGSLPEEYQIMMDPLETLTFVSANTNKISLGTSVIYMLFHNPVVLVRRFASLDILSQRRSAAGLGIGWSKDGFQVSNVPVSNKGKRADEYVRVLKKMWAEENVEFKGQYYSIPQSKIGPKPLQKPYIPIYLGGFSPNTIKRIVGNDLNGWLGIVGGVAPLGYVETIIKDFRNEAIKANKNADSFGIILLAYPDLKENSFIASGNNTDRPTLT